MTISKPWKKQWGLRGKRNGGILGKNKNGDKASPGLGSLAARGGEKRELVVKH